MEKKYVQQTSLVRPSSISGRQGVLLDPFRSRKPQKRSESELSTGNGQENNDCEMETRQSETKTVLSSSIFRCFFFK